LGSISTFVVWGENAGGVVFFKCEKVRGWLPPSGTLVCFVGGGGGGGGGGVVFGLNNTEEASDGHSVLSSWNSVYIKFWCSVSLGLF